MRKKASAAQDKKETLPDLELAQLDGQRVRLSDVRQDRNLVALFSGGAECGPCRHAIMSDVCGRPEEYAESGATAVVVLRCSPVEAELVRHREGLTVPVLLDPAGEACRLVGAQTADGRVGATIVITDCAGRICLQSGGERDTSLPTREAILNCLRNIAPGTCSDQAL